MVRKKTVIQSIMLTKSSAINFHDKFFSFGFLAMFEIQVRGL